MKRKKSKNQFNLSKAATGDDKSKSKIEQGSPPLGDPDIKRPDLESNTETDTKAKADVNRHVCLDTSIDRGTAFGSDKDKDIDIDIDFDMAPDTITERASRGEAKEHEGFRVLIPINSQDSALYAIEAAMARRWPANTQFMLATVIEGLSGGSLEAKIVHRDVLLAEQNAHRRAMRTWLNRLRDSFKRVSPIPK